MRTTLIAKCEEIINSSKYPHGDQGLQTHKIFSDLLQFYTDGSHDDANANSST